MHGELVPSRPPAGFGKRNVEEAVRMFALFELFAALAATSPRLRHLPAMRALSFGLSPGMLELAERIRDGQLLEDLGLADVVVDGELVNEED